MRHIKRAIVAILIAAVSTRSLDAQVVYDGGAPTGLGGLPMSSLRTAQGFTLDAPVTFNAIRFWGLSNNLDDAPFAGTLSWTIFSRSGATLGSQVVTGNAAPSSQLRKIDARLFSDSYQYDMFVGTHTLGDGDYFLEFGGAPTGFTWEYTTPNDEPAQVRSTSSGQVLSSSDDMAFQLRNVQVPEPSPVALLAAGAGLLCVSASRRKRSVA